MRNEFRIVADGNELTVHNRIKKAFKHWKDGYAYAEFIAVAGEGFSLYKKAELVDYNDNVNKGEMYATYKIVINEGEFPHKITSIGFAPYVNAELSNECAVSLRVSKAEIYGTVYIKTKRSDFSFYPGENPLVQSLLGARPFEPMAVMGRRAIIDNYPIVVDVDGYVPVNALVYIDDRGLIVNFNNTLGHTDFLLMWGDLPCARFNLAFFATRENTDWAWCQGGFFVDALAVSECEYPFGTYPNVSGLHPTGREALCGFEGYRLFGDPLFRCAGLCNGSDYYIVDCESLSVKRGGSYSGQLMMCSDGEVVNVEGGVMKLLGCGRTVEIPDGQTVVLHRDGGYDIFVYDGAYLTFFRLTDRLYQIENIDTLVGGTLSRLNDYAVMLKTDTDYKIFDINGELPFSYDAFSNLSTERVEDGYVYGEGYLGCVLSNEIFPCQKASGRFLLLDGELVSLGFGAAGLLSDFDFDSAAMAGNVAMFLSGGVLTFYRIEQQGVFVSVPYLGEVQYVSKDWSDRSCYVTLRIKD